MPLNVRRGVAALAALVGAAGIIAVGLLVFPTEPQTSAGVKFVGFIPLPKEKPAGLLTVLDYLTVDRRTLFVASETAGGAYQVDLSAGPLPPRQAVRWIPGAPAAHGVAVDPQSGLAFVSHSESNTVDVVDTGRSAVLQHIAVDDDVDGIIYVPGARTIYAVNGDPHLATLIDPQTRQKTGTIALGGKPEFAAYDPQTQLVYQNLEDANGVALVDVAKRTVVDRWSLAPCQSPTGMALDLVHRRMFVVCNANALLVVLDLATHHLVTSLAVGGGPDSVAYDPTRRRIYVAGRRGVLSVIQQDGPDAYRELAKVRLHYGAHTLAVDPDTGRVYAAYASLFIGPRLAVFEPTP
jgi:DNA-binding beta-propeller fold protein YncE